VRPGNSHGKEALSVPSFSLANWARFISISPACKNEARVRRAQPRWIRWRDCDSILLEFVIVF